MHWVDGWDWLWMTAMMGFWLVVLGAVIFTPVAPPLFPNCSIPIRLTLAYGREHSRPCEHGSSSSSIRSR